MYSLEFILKIIKSGTAEIISEKELCLLIERNKKINIKVGFDPTSKNLHLGHFLVLKKLKQFQELGYCVNFIIGDFTAMIGDPSGRLSSRKFLKKEEIFLNYKNYSKQIFKILNPLLTKIYFNSLWLNDLNINSLLNLMCKTNISKILERNDFNNRYISNKPINMNELIYPFLQGYDSVFLESDIEIGGIDQKLNFLLARDLQKQNGQKSQIFIMMPILTGIDGKQKMSKSLNNCINIFDKPYDIFCKIMSIPDFLMKEYFMNIFFFSEEEYYKKMEFYKNPMDVKKNLAYKVVCSLYNEKFAIESMNDFNKFFSEKRNLDNMDVTFVETNFDEIKLLDVLIKIKFLNSISEFKRFIKFGSIKINNEIIFNKNLSLTSGNFYFIKIGKFKIGKIFIKKK